MSLSFNGSEGGMIPRAAANQGIQTYKLSRAYTENMQIKAHYFGRNHIDQILAQPGCVGLRIWYGFGPDSLGILAPQLYIVGTDATGDDILPAGQELIADISMPCPRYCPKNSSLET